MTSADQLDMLNSRARRLHNDAVLAQRRGDQDALDRIAGDLVEIGRQTDAIDRAGR